MKHTLRRALALLMALLLATPVFALSEDARGGADLPEGAAIVDSEAVDYEVGEGVAADLGDVVPETPVEAPAGAPVSEVTYWFIVDDALVGGVTAKPGEAVSRPADPAAPAGMAFAGWTLEDGTPVFVNNEPIVVPADAPSAEVNVVGWFAEVSEYEPVKENAPVIEGAGTAEDASEAADEVVTEAMAAALGEEDGEAVPVDLEMPACPPTDGSADSDALLDGYVERLIDESLGDYQNDLMHGPTGSVAQPAMMSSSVCDRLTGTRNVLYTLMKADIQEIASGQRTSSVLTYTVDELNAKGANLGPWEFAASEYSVDAVNDKLGSEIGIGSVIRALLSDCPLELYWYKKTVEWKIDKGNLHCLLVDSNDKKIITFTGSISFPMPVVKEYAGSGENTVNADKVNVAQTAIANAQSIAAEVRRTYGKNVLACLRAFNDRICTLTSYNKDASPTGEYGNPWQLIWVFDGDPATRVVCEGYSKAFKYLFDLANFSDDYDCILAMGKMGTSGSMGDHMWNLVRMGSQGNYLVDVTNCDEGTVGYPYELFMAYDRTGQQYDTGYTFDLGAPYSYIYDDVTKSNFLSTQLTLSNTAYDSDYLYGVTVSGVTGGTVSVDKTEAAEDERVLLTVTPPTGSLLGTLTVNGVDVTGSVSGNSYAFNMPADAVSVSASFVRDIGYSGFVAISAVDAVYCGAQGASITVRDAKTGGVVDSGCYTVTYPAGGAAAGTHALTITGRPEKGWGGTATVQWTISPAPVTITGLSAANKTYDGTAAATIVGTPILSGMLSGDDVGVRVGAATFADKNVGANRAVTFSGFALTGAAAGNYTLSGQPAGVTASITAKPITVTADAKAKAQGQSDPALTYSVDGLIGGDALTGSLARDAGEAPGTYAIRQGSLSAGGNYAITFNGARLTITSGATPTPAPDPTPTPVPTPDPTPTPVVPEPDVTLLAAMKASGKKALNLSWTAVDGAEHYDVFFAQYGKGDCLLTATVDAPTLSRKITGLKKNKEYMAFVWAWRDINGGKDYIGDASPMVYAATGGYAGRATNPKKVALKTKNLILAPGAGAAVKASVSGVKKGKKLIKRVNKLRYYSSDRRVATVDENGWVTGVAAGSCTIHAVSNNGVRADVPVVVSNEIVSAAFGKKSYSVKKGKTTNLMNKLVMAPAGLAADCAWTSANPRIASVSDAGVVTGVKKGKTTITVTVDGRLTAKVKVVVK